MFTLIWGNDPIWRIVFQMGWFNHQLDYMSQLCYRSADYRRLRRSSSNGFRVVMRQGWKNDEVDKPPRPFTSCKVGSKYIDVFPKIGGFYPPKWMVKIMENPIKHGWFGGTIYIDVFVLPEFSLVALLRIKEDKVRLKLPDGRKMTVLLVRDFSRDPQ